MKKILFLANSEFRIINYSRALVVRLLDKNYFIYIMAPPGEKSERFKHDRIEYVSSVMSTHGFSIIKDFIYFIQIIKTILRYSPDVICSFTIKPNVYGAFASFACMIPNISNISGLGTVFIDGGFKSFVGRNLYKFSQIFSNKIFFQNNDDKVLFSKGIGKLLSCNRKLLIPGSGVDLEYFNKVPIPRLPIVFLYVGRLIKQKGVLELFDAAEKLLEDGFDFDLYLLGSSEEHNPSGIVPKIGSAKMRDKIKILGHRKDVLSYYKKAHFLILPSYREGLPKVVLEANAVGRPAIVSDVPGCRDIVSDGINGFLFQPKSSESIQQAMRKVFSMSYDEIAKMGQLGREIVELKYSDRVVTMLYFDTIGTLTES